MQQTFQDGVDSIYNAMVAAGATPGSKDPAGIASSISNNLGSAKVDEVLDNITGYSEQCVQSGAGSITLTRRGIYRIIASGTPTIDCSCPSGTGRYSAYLSIDGSTKDSYSGDHSARRGLTYTGYINDGAVISSYWNSWCTDCSRKMNGSYSITAYKWVFTTI